MKGPNSESHVLFLVACYVAGVFAYCRPHTAFTVTLPVISLVVCHYQLGPRLKASRATVFLISLMFSFWLTQWADVLIAAYRA